MEYLIVTLILIVFIAVVFILGFKQRASDEAIVNELSEDVKRNLEEAQMYGVDGIPNGAIVTGYVYRIRKQNERNAWLTVMYYNRYFPSLRDQIISVDLKVPLADMQANGVGEGSYIKMLFNEDKTPKPVFQ